MEASGAADDEPGLAGDDKLRRGVRALEDVGPRPGETLKEWAARIGTGCGWLEEHSKPLRAELTRMVGVWVERGYVLKNTPPRLTYTHCREVIAAWKHTFGPVVLGTMRDGWLGDVYAFAEMKKAALKSDSEYKTSLGKSALCRLDASLSYADAHRLAEECLELAAAARTAAARSKWVQQWQYLCYALIGPRAQLMLVSQDYEHSQFRAVFGSGDGYVNPVFKHAAYRRQPACLSLHHRSKNEQSRAPLNLIPARVTTLCPLFATGLLRLLQHGKSFANLAPPGWQTGRQEAVNWPALASAVNKPWQTMKQLYTDPLQQAAHELGMRVEGGLLKTLRQLNVMHTSSNIDCTDEEGARIAEHNREGRRDRDYYTMHGRSTQLIAHYLTNDPTQAASLCALTELLTERDEEMTELVLSGLSDSFGDAIRNSATDEPPKSARNFFEITMYLIKVAIVMSRARVYNAELRITEECRAPIQAHELIRDVMQQAHELIRDVMQLSFGVHPFLSHIDSRIAHYEAQEIALGDAVMIPASLRFANNLLLKASLRGVEDLINKTSRVKMRCEDTNKLYAQWENNQISDEVYADLVARAQPCDAVAARHLLGMSTPLSESFRTDARLYRTAFEREHDPMSQAERQADERNEEAVKLCIMDMRARGEWSDSEDAAQTFSLPQIRPGDQSVVRPAKRPRISDPPSQSPPPQPSLALSLVTSAPAASSSSPSQPSPSNEPPTQSFIDSQFSYLTTDATLGVIVGRFVHRWLPLEFKGGKAPAGSGKILQRQRDFLFKALSLTVADGETVPRPCQLRHVLHNVQMGVARKVDWASDMLKETRADMMRYVYGVANLKATFKFDASVLEALQSGIGEDGSTSPDPASLPAAPPAPSPPASPEQQLFVGLDPGCCDSSYGVAVATVLSGSIVRVQYDSFKPRGWKDTTAHSLKLGSATEKLVSYLHGAEAVFIEGFYFDKATASGANTSFYMRAAGHMAAYQAGTVSSEVNFSDWGKIFPKQGSGKQRTAGPSLLNRFEIAVPACNDAIDAICIVLYELVHVRGLPLSVTAYEPFSAS